MTAIKRAFAGLVAVLLVALAPGCASSSRADGARELTDDAILTSQVKAALLDEPTLKSDEIKVDTYRGVVRLSGFVRSTAEEVTAIAIARGVAGVKSVRYDTRLK